MTTPRHSWHRPTSVEELTEKNVQAIVELDAMAQKQRTSGDRVADAISNFCGSMTFVWVHVIWFAAWIVINRGGTPLPVFDPYPFNFLTLVVSLEAIFLSTFILISGNRQARLSERRSHLDLQINLLSEQENTKTLRLLREIALKVGVDPSADPDISILEQATRPDALAAQIDASINEASRQREEPEEKS